MTGKKRKRIFIIKKIIIEQIHQKKNYSDEFIDFFLKFEKINKLSEELNFLLKCGIAYFQSYIEYLKTPEEKLKKTWNTKIKPLILKKYPVQKSGIFNVNADVEKCFIKFK